MPASGPSEATTEPSTGDTGPKEYKIANSSPDVFGVAFIGSALFCLAIGVAIMKYRLRPTDKPTTWKDYTFSKDEPSKA